MSSEQAVKELLVDTSNELEYVTSISREHEVLPTEDEIVSKIKHLASKLGWTMEEAFDYVDFMNNRY